MADIKSWPNNQDVYVGAEWVMKWLHGRTSGVFGADDNAAVTAVPGMMAVEVSDGLGWLANAKADGVVWWNDYEANNGSKLKLDVDVADGVLDRIDRVVVSWETTNYVALPQISIIKGDIASNPSPPALVNNSTMRQISLAQISVPAGTLELTPILLLDERLDPDVCGIVTETIKIDTSMFQSQFEALLKAVQDELSNIVGGTGFDPIPVRVENIAITPAVFSTFAAEDEEETKLIEMGYEYRGAVALEGVLASMFPYITLSLFDVDECGAGIANQYKCYNGGVYIYADGVPEANITALTMEFRKAVS